MPQLTVEWVSSDASETSVREVDASDLSAFSQELGYALRWGFPGEPVPYPGAPPQNYRMNFAPFGTAYHIDAGDLSAFAQDLPSACNLSKSQADADAEREAIMSWFGFAPTGRRIPVEPSTDAPEYVLADTAQNERAIANPYGYRNRVASEPATKSSWSLVKRLYH